MKTKRITFHIGAVKVTISDVVSYTEGAGTVGLLRKRLCSTENGRTLEWICWTESYTGVTGTVIEER